MTRLDEVTMFADWPGWCRANPHIVSLAAGAFAGTASETLLFPLDCLKTRLQSRRGFYQSGGFRGIYKGVGTAICAAAPASAIFFSTYETSKRTLTPYLPTNSVVGYCSIGLLSSIVGELAAGVYRVPMDLVKQRQQAGHGQCLKEVAQSVRRTHSSVFFASYLASFMRDIMHSSLQFPLYEYLKLATGRWKRKEGEGLPTWQAASCGSVAGVVSAVLTTPLDLLRTRLNLRGVLMGDAVAGSGSAGRATGNAYSALGLLREEVVDVYRSRGARGFFAGGACRAAWMGLGGFVFLGSFEMAKKNLLGEQTGEGTLSASGQAATSSASGSAGAGGSDGGGAAPPPPSGSRGSGSAASAPGWSSGGSSSSSSAGPGSSSSGSGSSASSSWPFGGQASDPAVPAAPGGPKGVEVKVPPLHAAAWQGPPEEPARGSRQLGPEPPAKVSLMAGLLAGMAVDIPLHPLDTVKTRMQSPEGFKAAGGVQRVWSGLSAVLVVSVPGSAFFFVVYDFSRHCLERRVPVILQDDRYAIGRDAVAASLADVSACVVRVPCEVLKQRMQALGPGGAPLTFRGAVRRVSQEGVRGFFAGFGATAMREVPFALIQMPLFEELKHRHPWTAEARQRHDTGVLGLVGMQSGCLAGSFAGVATTPLDAVKTRIILTESRADRRGLFETMMTIRSECGMGGLFRGMLPRAVHCGLGGALWLGAFEWSKLLLWGA